MSGSTGTTSETTSGALLGTLYLVPTPIGNLDDMSPRARATLSAVGIIACEDTRVSAKLFSLLNIPAKKLISYHDYNEEERASGLLAFLESGVDVAVVTDAGSPGISDPAFRIVREAISAGVKIVSLPGPNAIIPALTASGLPTDRFFFEGFLPQSPGQRRKRLKELADYPHTIIFFESPHRIASAVNDALVALGNRPACVAREISKMYEEFLRGNLSDLAATLRDRVLKGEITLIIAGKAKTKREKVNKYRRDEQ